MRCRPPRDLPQRAHSRAHLALRDRAAPVELGEARGFRPDARAQPSGYRDGVLHSRAELQEEEERKGENSSTLLVNTHENT